MKPPEDSSAASRHERAGELFLEALDLPPSERSAFLSAACANDAAMLQEVVSLLEAQAGAGDFLANPLLNDLRDPKADPDGTRTSSPAGRAAAEAAFIGPYRLLQLIGEGGMGEVWLAEQRHPVRRRVAVKLIKIGMDTREVVARFETERQALALMDHPAIAKVLDAGSTPQGRPYFVMEYVPGMPITDYCDRHKLATRQRLELFSAVCDGVQHAHQKAILHRDLKPSNILVGEVDGKPVPRIIDFGVAKATAGRLTAHTMFTGTGAMIGTPLYMSPEQADSGGMDVDTRTDVYSLGVVLYQLLVGALPLDFSKTPLDEFPRKLREEDAPRPSTRLRTLGDQSSAAAGNRGADEPTLERQLRGDLDAITLKALEKDRSRRYATPSDLAADIGRYLRNEPVLARPAGFAYRARKYIRRNRLAVAFAATAALLLISLGVAQTFELRRTTRERDRANRESARANRVTDFMTGMFKVSDPSEARGNDIRAREILDRASQEIDKGLVNDPELQAQMMDVMGTVYGGLGLYSKAETLLRRAVEIRRKTLGSKNPDTLKSMYNLAGVLSEEGRYPEAEKLCRETLETRRAELGPEHRDTLASNEQLAGIFGGDGHFAEAEKLDRETLAIATQKLGPQDKVTAEAARDLAQYLLVQRKYPQAEKAVRDRLDIDRRLYGAAHPEVFADLYSLAVVLTFQHRYTETESVYRDLIQFQTRVLGPEHPDTLNSTAALAGILYSEKRYGEAEKMYRDTLATERRILGPDYAGALAILGRLGSLLINEKRYSEAETTLRETLERLNRVWGPANPHTSVVAYNLGCALALQGKLDDAMTNLRFAVEHEPHMRLRLEKDPDLKSLQTDPRFKALVAESAAKN